MRLLLVDGDGVSRYTVSKALQRVGYMVGEAGSGEAALERFAQGDFDLVLSEIDLPGMSGIALLQAIKTRSQDSIVILMAESVSVETAIEALRYGARDLPDQALLQRRYPRQRRARNRDRSQLETPAAIA